MNHEELKKITTQGKLLLESLKPADNTPSTNQNALAVLKWGILIIVGLERRIPIANDELGYRFKIRKYLI